MALDTTKDPIHQVLESVWITLRANTTLTTLIPTGNQVDYTSTDRDPEKQGLLSADLPQMRVVLKGLQGQIPATSSSCTLTIEIGIELLAGDKRFEILTSPIWEIYQAMSHYRQYIFQAVTYNTENPVKKMMPLKAEIDLNEKRDPPTPAGWVGVWACALELFFSTNTVKA